MKSIIVRDPIMEKKETRTKLVGAVEMVKIIERENLLELNRCFLVRVISASGPAVAPSDYDHVLEKYKVVLSPKEKRAQKADPIAARISGFGQKLQGYGEALR